MFLSIVALAFGQSIWAQNPVGLKELNTLFLKGNELRTKNKVEESIPFFEKAAEMAPQVFGPQHSNTASIHRTAGSANFDAHRFAVAEKHFRISLEIREAILPKGDPQIGAVYSDLGVTLMQLGKYKESEASLKRAMEIFEAKFSKDDPQLSAPVINLGNLYSRTSKTVLAAAYFERALRMMEKKWGNDHFQTAFQLHNLSTVYQDMGRFQEAESFARRSMAIRIAKLGSDHISIADNLNVIGLVEHSQGKFRDAEVHLCKALEMREKHFGKDSLEAASSLNNVGILYGHSGRLDEAETYLLRAIAIRERKLGRDHPLVAHALSTLGVILQSFGRREEAGKLLQRSLAIQEGKLGSDNPGLESTLVSLASNDHDLGRLDEAEKKYLRVLAILEGTVGKDHVANLGALNNLATVYLHSKRPEQARDLLLRVQDIREKYFGKNHPGRALTASNLGGVYFQMRDYAKAEEYYRESVKVSESVGGKDAEELAQILPGLAQVYEATDRMDDARKTLDRCLSIYQIKLRNMFSFSSEAAMFDYIEANDAKLLNLVSLAVQEQNDAKMADASLTWMLRLRGTVFESVCQYRQAQLMLRDADLEKKVTRYRTQKTFLANAAVTPPQGISADKLKKQVDDAEREVDELDKEIRRTLTRNAPNAFAAREGVNAQQVREKLPADGALVEFCNMRVRYYKKGGWSKQVHYVALIQPRTGPVRTVDLGVAKDIDDGVEELRKEIMDFQEKLRDCETPEEMLSLEQKQEKQFTKKSAALHGRLFAPLRPHLGKATQLYLVCDGSLNRLPFESLVNADGKYLVESYRCVYLSSGRDLLRPSATKAKGTVVFAGPDYKLDAEERLAQVKQILKRKETQVASRSMPANQLRSAGWKNLPGAAAEAKDIQRIIDKGKYGPVTAYVGPRALEEVLKAMPAPRVLHLATHGFFLDRETDSEPPPDDGAGAGWARGRLKRVGSPLLRSGIVLAGANTIGDKEATARVDDGWVTAEEIALLNLQGTELVVLSACQTGLGDIKSGEGVYGLRRAFLYAGARSLVTSLFEVPDTETRELMRRFYTGLSSGQGKLRALHSAQRSFIDDRRKTQGTAHPFFWSSFILVGDAD
jgi:CHAT domain-containing protein/Tfp pilus assembly protein PilF